MGTANTTSDTRFEDWRAKAIQLRQVYVAANASFTELSRAGRRDRSLLESAHQAGLRM
jgi:hypothetical protein